MMKNMIVALAVLLVAASGALAGELVVEDLVVGTGRPARTGDTASVHYEGWLEDGKRFDSSLERGQQLVFRLGARQVIKGWEQGIKGMKVGGKRRLVIPPELAYGDREVGGGLIPANSILIFEVELLGLE
jgi:FKBP-type peptidyl-prolyl cis-trans isomerase